MALITDNDKSGIVNDDTYDGEYYNFDDVLSSDEMDIHLIYYDWLADSAATTHITYQCDAFITYETIPEVLISGVGRLKTHMIGQGRVNLWSKCDGKMYILELHNVLHVLDNHNNLLSLGRWETVGCSYIVCDGILSLLTKDRKPVTRGAKVRNNLYKMTFKHAPETAHSDCMFNAASPSRTWKTWHQRFGHIGYSGIKKLLNNQLVNGLKIDTNSPKPDCVACTEAKLSETPYGPTLGCLTKPGELMHMDLWGKYDVMSINRNQYYLLMVDDAMHYVTVKFLKMKDQAAQKIMDYMTYLKAQGKTPCTICADRGTEFVNETLREWCSFQGVELQVTTPYSPLQNGVAERMNCTLVELACTMLTASELPEFLWEAAVAHAVLWTKSTPSRNPVQTPTSPTRTTPKPSYSQVAI